MMVSSYTCERFCHPHIHLPPSEELSLGIAFALHMSVAIVGEGARTRTMSQPWLYVSGWQEMYLLCPVQTRNPGLADKCRGITDEDPVGLTTNCLNVATCSAQRS